MSGSKRVMRKAQIQLKVKATEVPTDLASAGNSSTLRVHASGPIPKIKGQCYHFENIFDVKIGYVFRF
jgi:hypothetical protein